MNVFYVKQTLSYAKMGGVTHNFPDTTPPITSAVLTVRCPLRCLCPRRFIKLPAPLLPGSDSAECGDTLNESQNSNHSLKLETQNQNLTKPY